ncbi:trafficking protein particle complex subunit 10-like [Anneissia japonica]|uniref:trafficking protein particle complex subunit 10-like n=1 Tax=Anneissia japonica TaxID=1529436 RepID=UPI001425951F|nr:trafficking protein particle complex subunit 10-like [Anneissia japonica]
MALEEMENKPIVTCHGEQELFKSIHPELIQSLPRDPVEWRRSYGRAPKTISVDVQFVPFSIDILQYEGSRQLLHQSFFHLYWTECPDVDAYKIVVKEEISKWQQTLKEKNISDWMIVLVEASNPKRGQKTKLLPRTSVFDKIKNDFCSKQSDRCIVLHEPNNPVPSVRSQESWTVFLGRLRQLILTSYNRNLGKFEEKMRAERERRNEPGWDFNQYFLLQEELAFVYEMLRQYDEALVQYDELDALFSQFVINSQAAKAPEWLNNFNGNCTRWDGLDLSRPINQQIRELIKTGKPTLLDIRNYLFSRQCVLLLFLNRPLEVANRTIAFLHNCVQELRILEITMPTGSVDCWVLLSSLEILDMCEKRASGNYRESYSYYSASLRAYAQSKLHQLGLLCGLMPDTEPTSEQLNMVVELLSGMGHLQPLQSKKYNSQQKLREALSSKEAFQKTYLELSEIAMGTFKHIGRQRSAKMMGKHLASFYMKRGEAAKAEGFLSDALKVYVKEGWKSIAIDTRKELAKCQKTMGNTNKYVKSCAVLASEMGISKADKEYFFNEMMEAAEKLNDAEDADCTIGNAKLVNIVKAQDDMVEESNKMSLEEVFTIESMNITPSDGKLTHGQEAKVTICIRSRFPEPVTVDQMVFSLSSDPIDKSPMPTSQKLFPGKVSSLKQEAFAFEEEVRVCDGKEEVEASSFLCVNAQKALQREDSSSSLILKELDLQYKDYKIKVDHESTVLEPGNNTLNFTFEARENGKIEGQQLWLKIKGLELILPRLTFDTRFIVNTQEPMVVISANNNHSLLAGVPQDLKLFISTGYYSIKSCDAISIQTIGQLEILKLEESAYNIMPCSKGADVNLPETAAYSEVELAMIVRAPLATVGAGNMNNDETCQLEQKMTLWCPWAETVVSTLSFQQPFRISHHLRTAGKRKFIQVSVENLCCAKFRLTDPEMKSLGQTSVKLQNLHPLTEKVLLPTCTMSYMWRFAVSDNLPRALECQFSIQYELIHPAPPREMALLHTYSFTLEDFTTQYIVSSSVSPSSNDAMCRAGKLCNLQLHVQVTGEHLETNTPLMYEVVTDSNTWAVCGKNNGLLNIEENLTEVSLQVIPLTAGYLPLPAIKLSRYMQQDRNQDAPPTKLTMTNVDNDTSIEDDKFDTPDCCNQSLPSLQAFSLGQVYLKSHAMQVHVLPENNESTVNIVQP